MRSALHSFHARCLPIATADRNTRARDMAQPLLKFGICTDLQWADIEDGYSMGGSYRCAQTFVVHAPQPQKQPSPWPANTWTLVCQAHVGYSCCCNSACFVSGESSCMCLQEVIRKSRPLAQPCMVQVLSQQLAAAREGRAAVQRRRRFFCHPPG